MDALQEIHNILANYKDDHRSAYIIYDKGLIRVETKLHNLGYTFQCFIYTLSDILTINMGLTCGAKRVIHNSFSTIFNQLDAELVLSLLRRFISDEKEQINIAADTFDVTYYKLIKDKVACAI